MEYNLLENSVPVAATQFEQSCPSSEVKIDYANERRKETKREKLTWVIMYANTDD